MKKLVLMAVAIVAVSFASCGKKADKAQATADSIRIADSIAAVQEAAAATADTTATADSAAAPAAAATTTTAQ